MKISCLCTAWIFFLAISIQLCGEDRVPAPARHVPWIADVQPSAISNGGKSGLERRLSKSDGSPITTLEEWQQKRAEIRSWWLGFLGLPERDPQRPRATMIVLQKEAIDGVTRCLIRYETPGNWPIEAYLLFPLDCRPLECNETILPAVVVFHSTTNETIRQPAGLTAETTKAFALQLAKRGYVTLAPRCYLWGVAPPYDYQAQVRRFQELFPKAKGMAKMLVDGMAAVDLLVSLPGVDRSRIGAIGHSLGGKEVLYLAAFDERIRATISSEGGIGLSFSNWDAPWYLGPEIHDSGFRHDHHELLALIAPRVFLLIGGDSADGEKSLPYLRAAWEVYRLFTDRPALGLWNHRQGHSVPTDAEQRIVEWFDVYLGRDVVTASSFQGS
ncbi:MAG: dienelactone hydrolase family protein [Thermogutta sp.]